MRNRTIGVVVNPRSRRHRRGAGLSARLGALLRPQDLFVEARSEAELFDSVLAMRDAGVETVAVSGGDGTAGFVLTALVRAYGDRPLPRLALLRGGTMNTVANGVGIHRAGPARLLHALVEAHRGSTPLRTREFATLEIQTAGADPRHGFLFGVGVGSAFLEQYYGLNPEPTPVTAVHTLARLSASVAVGGPLARRVTAPLALDVEVDGVSWPSATYLTILAGTVEQVGLGFRPFFRARTSSLGFHLVGVHGSAAKVLPRLYRTHRGRPLGLDCAQDALAAEAKLTASSGELGFFLDGDLYQAQGTLTLRLGPRVEIVLL